MDFNLEPARWHRRRLLDRALWGAREVPYAGGRQRHR